MVGSRAHIGQALRALHTRKGTITCQGRVHPLSHFARRVAAIAAGLSRSGLRPGDRVAIAALNSEWYMEWLLAVPCAGGIIAPLNYRWSVEEASEAVQLIGATMLVLDETCLHQWPDLHIRCPSLRLQILLGPELNHFPWVDAEKVVKSSAPNPELNLKWAPDSIALICFTSGTTGRPKGVAISHNALVVQSLAKIAVVGYSSSDVYLHISPLCHIGGISSALANLMAGASHVILPKFHAAAVSDAIQNHHVTSMIIVPAMLADVVTASKSTKGGQHSFPSVRTLLNGAGGIPAQLLDSTRKLFPDAAIMSAYGMTEACSSMSFTPIHEQSSSGQLGGVCVGRPAPHVELKIGQRLQEHNPADTKEKTQIDGGLFREGSVLTRGPHVMERYWGLPKETAAVLSEDGWLDTGDVGWLDEAGRLWLLGRHKDVIKSGGENVYASEVESVLMKHPGIIAVAVVGIPDERMNETVVAFVRLRDKWLWEDRYQGRLSVTGASNQIQLEDYKDNHVISEIELRIHCQQLGLSRYKVPRLILVSKEAFPTTSTGKVKKDAVRKLVLAQIASKTNGVDRMLSIRDALARSRL